MIDLKKL